MEIGPNQLSADYLARFDKVLETGGLFVGMLELIRLHAEPDWFRPWGEIEREAVALRWYDPAVVPGLLQTEAYARAMLRAGPPLTDEQIEKRVLARLTDGTEVAHLDNQLRGHTVDGPNDLCQPGAALGDCGR
ncbi:hypothetical protein KBX50_10545 [Micromonospora sp. C51]|uniref:Scr1 family TA system antitoxin-like transcriptional regulator n=1 Tax=Micromonospora sp. C51 TaxID=2824879 RepID=UPI001B36B56E|nr:Scr1 family TA system antitoxin-like transcriptional regulator [Micromonospora sp. C51]MBQ1048892.1 hypothetical protein [Micromonospora sp. C51]